MGTGLYPLRFRPILTAEFAKVATEHNIPMIENKPLRVLLYDEIEV